PTLSTVTIASNNSNTTLAKTGDTITLTIVASENLTSTPTVTITGDAVTTTGSGTNWTATYTMVDGDTEDVVPFTINFSDIATNAGTQVSTKTSGSDVTFDKTAPAVAITAPTADSRVNATKVITFTNDSNSTPTVAECSINNTDWVACTSGSTTLSALTGFNAWADGTFTLYLKDADTAGNTGTDSETGITKDSSAPTITVSSLTPSDNAVGISPASPTISATFDEAIVAGDSDVELRVDGGATVTATASFDDSNKLTITPSTSLANNTKYQVTIKTTVKDTAGNALEEAKVWHFTTSAAYSIALTTGWNLISLPVVPSASTAIADVLGATAVANINAVWAYDVTTGWSVYRPDGSGTSNLTTMTAGYGYWIDYKSAPTTNIAGIGNLVEPGNSNIPERTLKAGWNLVGYYQRENTSNSTAHNAFANNLDGYWNETLLIGHNNSSKNISYLTQASTVNPGEGFWILLTDDRIYTIGNVPNP
ncbi:MAG: Ig-like domain-containing protein, partial [Candidatus Berkelbacteria bacterium]|nr:Ig-like domain-containing protein [Candidatus Berkelbacteria bacterium]